MTNDLPWPPPTPFALYAYDGHVTADLLWRLLHVHGTPIRHPLHGWVNEGPPGLRAGTAWSDDQVKQHIDGILAGEWWRIPIIPPGGVVQRAYHDHPPLFELHGFNNLPTAHAFEDGRPDIPYTVFQPPKFPYLYLQGNASTRFDVRLPFESDRFLATMKAVACILRPSFVACDDADNFEGPQLHDPRSRAWGISYYGPNLVEQLGGPNVVERAPASKVERDPDLGGYWVHLDELPFIDSSQRAARREAVEEHLRLAETFPNVA